MNALFAILLAAAIEPRAIRAHIDFLASDLLEGRESGTRGHEIAAAYVAAQFAAAGVEPAGDEGTYLQQVHFRTLKIDAEHSTLCIRAGDGACAPFVHRQDVLIGPSQDAERELVDVPVVLAGFGIVAPKLGQDDYANLDVRGKFVAIISGAPARFPPSERAIYSDGTTKLRTAAEHGAIGLITIRSLDSERRFAWSRIIGQDSGGPSFRALDADGQPLEAVPAIRASATLGNNAAEALLRGAPVSLEQLLADADKSIPHSFALNTRVSMHVATTLGDQTSPNVAGVIRGSDPRLAAEYVVLSAHLDHLGLANKGDDRVRNGALDNASGIAALIEIARKIAALPHKPARSILFVAVTAEEKGEQGSLAFAHHPTVSGPIVANVNMDMLTMLFPLKSLVALGVEHSTLGPLAREAAKQAGFELQDDPLPEEVRFIRSDQYSFVKQGIPAITYKAGFASRDPKIDGDKLTRDWMRTVYHSVADNPDQPLDYPSGARWAEANCNLVLAIANAKERPRWNEGDLFAK